jgi:hypothetical protein
MPDDGGVLGNLPRSRPGRRSDKRAGGPAAAAPPPPPPPPAEPQDDPIGGAIRTATGLAAAGARVANGVARQVVRRIPRP